MSGDVQVHVTDDGWEWRIERALVGWFWLVAHNGDLYEIGWRPLRRMAQAKAQTERDTYTT